ncbi:hypothetical protein J3Q64DRAFT_1697556 [Phycomyces blakesleeanus]|uniref:Protein kinase domain-containing protein n=1 Tax=Phycomyces blakesleeanus TaxID=4837 RepID=A0ABR3B209_PHYBL
MSVLVDFGLFKTYSTQGLETIQITFILSSSYHFLIGSCFKYINSQMVIRKYNVIDKQDNEIRDEAHEYIERKNYEVQNFNTSLQELSLFDIQYILFFKSSLK